MSVERAGGGTVGRTSRGRALRPAWSLAAGTGIRPRVPVVVPVIVIALVIALDTYVPLGGSRRLGRHAAPWLVALAYPSWLTIARAATELRRVLGESRRRARDGAVWWRDRAWHAKGAEQPIGAGMQATSFAHTFAVAATLGACAFWVTLAPGSAMYMTTDILRVVPTPAYAVVATWALPLIWLVVVVGPRLERGRLVVAWPELPQRTGTRVTFHVATSPGGARIDGVRVFLRCVRTRSRPLLPLPTWNARLAWVAEARLPLGAYVGPDTHLRAEFDVPPDTPSTDLHADDAVRWELLVLGTVGAADYAQSVDVPVYSN